MRAAGGRGALRVFEWLLLGAGLVLLGIYAAGRIHGRVGRDAALRQFEAVRDGSAPSAIAPSTDVDDSLWSRKRVAAYRASLEKSFPPPLAVLRVPRIGLEVPVLDGTDDLTLNRAVGRIAGTARPGEPGNLGIAGHRDGFFRGLKDIGPGDAISLETLSGPEDYVVESIRIVTPTDVWVLDPTPAAVLTLVTCYPFYFVGDAPQRYVVRAVRSGVQEASAKSGSRR